MNRLLRFDETSRLATFGAGITGPELEAQLRARGYTLGHFPQSFEFSTLGGWVATRSSGQQSLGYGRIEDLFAGGRLEAPAGTLEILPIPASATGPDLREVVLGSEGRLGVFTELTVYVRRLPAHEDFHVVFFPDFEYGLNAVRELVQAELALSMVRLSNPSETMVMLALAGRGPMIGALDRLLAWRKIGEEKCMLLLGVSGRKTKVRAERKEALGIAKRHRGIHLGRPMGRRWHNTRFRAPYLRNTLWETGYAVDTLETAVNWIKVPIMVDAIEKALHSVLKEEGIQVHAFSHLSHVYLSGSSIYTTYLFPLASHPEETLQRWRTLKEAASRAIVKHGGTISHHHGVGQDHAPYLSAEKGSLGMSLISDLCHCCDPTRIMNPGKLIDLSAKV
jgi:alkyldihydroxyacetonephosphate synthase